MRPTPRYLQMVTSSGSGAPLSTRQPYQRKTYAGYELGRSYPPWLSLPWLSRCARMGLTRAMGPARTPCDRSVVPLGDWEVSHALVDVPQGTPCQPHTEFHAR